MIHNTQSAQISQKQDERNICYHENNAPSWLSPHWLCGNSCTWAHDVRLSTSCAQVHELPQSHCGDNREGTLFSQKKLLEWLRNICITKKCVFNNFEKYCTLLLQRL